MIIHSKQFTSNVDEKCIQPNAIDIRISAITRIGSNKIQLSEHYREHRDKLVEQKYLSANTDGEYWDLTRGSYEFETDHWVKIPDGICGWIVPRSTLNRNGVFISSGLYDSGFENYIGGVMHVMTGTLQLFVNTRIGQFITTRAETNHLYDGAYNAQK